MGYILNISADCIFHFTEKKENIVSILRNGFLPTYCIENVDFAANEKYSGFAPAEIAIPMVCFCDIPLSQIERHVKNYGGYAIGLTKGWGERNGINPVLYELPDSNPIKIIRDCLNISIPFVFDQNIGGDESGKRLNDIGNKLIFFFKYLKPYKGKRWDGKGFSGDEIRFYNEREWRYIPDFYEMEKKGVKLFLKADEYLNKNLKADCNSKLQSEFKLVFSIKDIKYVIVDNEDEIHDIISEIEAIEGNFDVPERKLLLTKILSLDRLKEDF
jgi:hypothetical protein